jgi:voltage-gated potassium channel
MDEETAESAATDDPASKASGRTRLGGGWIRVSLVTVSVSAMVVASVGALLSYAVDRDDYGSFGEALWWSIVTVSTVGYGDFVPTDNDGRLVGAIVIIFSMAFFPVLTGLITTLIITRAQEPGDQQAEREAKRRQAELVQLLTSIDERLERLDERAAPPDAPRGGGANTPP